MDVLGLDALQYSPFYGALGHRWTVLHFNVVGRDGFEPSTKRLKVFCSTD